MEIEIEMRKLMKELTTIIFHSYSTAVRLKIGLNDDRTRSGILKGFDFKNDLNTFATITLILFDEGREGDEVTIDLKDIREIIKL